MKWDCRGIKEQLNKIQRSGRGFAAYKALKALDTTITSLVADSDNDTNALLTYRRQVRMTLRSYR